MSIKGENLNHRNTSLISRQSDSMAFENSDNDGSKQPSQLSQLLPCPDQAYEYVKKYSVHAKSRSVRDFPLHLYLMERYSRLSLHQQVIIFRQYFDSQKSAIQLNINPTHVQILNQGISLFTKVPENPMVFLFIDPYNEHNQIITLKNYQGEIIHFQLIQKNKKRSTIIGEIKRKMKGKPFFIIRDSGQIQQQGLASGNCFNSKILKKLNFYIKFYYIKVISSQAQLQFFKNQFFSEKENQKQVYHRKMQQKIQLELNDQQCRFYAYSFDREQQSESEGLIEIKKQLGKKLQDLIKEQETLIQANTSAKICKFRLRIFDTLYINFLKSFKSKQKLIELIESKWKKYMYNLNDANSQVDHFPGRLLNSQRCKHCEALGRRKNKKSKYKCLACSINFQTDIPICIKCWGDFHESVLPVCRNSSAKDIKRVYEAHLRKNRKNIFNGSSLQCKIGQQYAGSEQIDQTIIKLDENMTQIEKIIRQLQSQSLFGAKIVKKFNEVLLLNILDSFNDIMQQVNQANRFQGMMTNQNGQSSDGQGGSPTDSIASMSED